MTNANTLTDKEYYQLTISVGKALNPQELPIKQKHVRAAIIATWMSNGGHAFWAIAIRQQLQDNRITAWKFLYMLHKILREGHPAVIAHSMRHRTMLTELGKLWGHLNDGYGICILQYTKLLVMKLNFHDRNARFPGNLVLKRGELEKIAGNDINIYFQLAIEMFDYLDEIIALQATIFNSITTFAVSSMTAAGQCRLVPLIPCIQDSNQLYDFCVRLMFLLHANLQEDLLVHHRERFRTIFRQLNSFYKQAGQLQYFHNLITVPHLPHNPPNFLVQADLGNYTAPKIVLMNENNDNISESDASSIVGDLVDTNAVDSPQPVEETPPLPPKIDYERLLNERDEMINKLRHEQEVQLSKARRAFSEKIEKENQLQEQVMKLTTECSDLQNEIANLKLQKQELELKAETAPELEQKVQVEEEKAKQTEEKFQKLKNMYTQIRDEHIKLLRKHDETNKTLQEKTKELQEISQEHEESKMKLQEIEVQKSTISENYQKSSIETEQLKQQFTNIEYEKKNLMDQIQSIESKKSAEIAELRINFEAVETKCKQLEEQLEKVEEEKKILISESEGKLSENEEKFEQLKAEKEKLEEEMKIKEQKLMEELEATKNELTTQSANQISEIKNNNELSLRALMEALLKGCEEISLRSVQENETLGTQTSAAYYIMIMQELQDLLDKLKVTYGGYSENCSENAEALAVTVVNSGHMLSLAFDRGMTIANASTNMVSGEKIATEIKECGNISANFFKLLASNSDNATVNDSLQQLKDKLYSITNMIGDLSSNKDEIEKLEELVEAELNGMDKAIEEASKKIMEMLAQSRASDTGIKLEVNEKILDSCTDLMKFIKVLVQKSRKVQAEIIATGKGTATAKEFYKRNHQWTEGLISAAGSVAAAAKLLVESANKAVSEQSKHTLDVVVAAQEIAASVATLVVASRVKASRDSQSLRELTLASKDVTQSTSMVVATAKNCSQQLEENQELDFTKLSIHQAKTREMELQVKILELEQSIQTERMKLAALRRQNYQNGD